MQEATGQVMQNQHSSSRMEQLARRDIGVMALAALVIIVGMLGFFFFPSPSGHRTTFWEFVAFWARELIIVGGVLVAIVVAGISKLGKLMRRGKEGG